MKKLELRFGEKMNVENVENEGKEEKQLKIEGYVNITNTPSDVILSEDGEPFTEKIEKGAFKKALDQQQNDINLLFEHDKAMILASTKNGSLELAEDEKGLFIKATLLKSKLSEHIYELISKNFLEGMSFGFICKEAEMDTDENGNVQRVVKNLQLIEVSIVQQPAYNDTTLSTRSKSFELKAESFNKYNNAKRNGENLNMKKVQTRSINKGKNFLVETRNMNKTTDDGGGSAIPVNVAEQIIERVAELSDVFQNSTRIDVSEGHVKVPFETVESGQVKAGIVVEGEQVTPQKFALKSKTLKHKRLTTAIQFTKQMENMSNVSLLKFVDNSLSRRIALGFDALAFNSAVAESEDTFCDGILTADGIVELEYDEHDLHDKIVEAVTNIPTATQNQLKVYVGKKAYASISLMKLTTGEFLVQNGIVNGILTQTILGLPLVVTDGVEGDEVVVMDPTAVTVSLNERDPLEIIHVTQDSAQALSGGHLAIINMYVDSAVTNSRGIVRLKKKA